MHICGDQLFLLLFSFFNINSETTIGFRKHPHFQYKKYYIPDYTGMLSANWWAVGSALTIDRKQFPTPQRKIRVVQINGGAMYLCIHTHIYINIQT